MEDVKMKVVEFLQYGSGDGSGDGIKKFEGHEVFVVDDMPTLIYTVHGNYARGAILQSDLNLAPCFIAKVGDSFAHGSTLREAFQDAKVKSAREMPIEERIRLFVQEHSGSGKYAASELYGWHNVLTGSCRMGRDAFCKEHRISMDDTFTVKEFISLTESAYGGEIIKELKKFYKEK